MDVTQKNKFSWLTRDLIGFSLTSLFNDLSHEMTTSLLPTFTEHIVGKVYAPISLGIITGCADAASTFMKLLSGWLSNHIRNFKPVLIIGYALTPLFVSLIGTAQHVGQIFAYQTAAWMGRGLREPMRDVWIANITAAQNYGKTFGLQRAFDTIGALVGPCIIFFTVTRIPLRSNFFLALIPGTLSVLCLIFLTGSYKKTSGEKKVARFLTQLQQLPYNFKYFVGVIFLFGIGNFSRTFLIYQAQHMLAGQATSSIIATSWAILLYMFFNSVRATAEFSMGYLSDYINRRVLLSLFGFGFFGVINILLLYTTTQLWLWIVIFSCAGFSIGTVTSLEKSYAAQLLPEQSRGTGFGFLQSLDGIGDLVSSAIVGGLWSFISPQIAFIYAAFLSFIATVLLLLKKD